MLGRGKKLNKLLQTGTTGAGFEFCDHKGCTLDLKILASLVSTPILLAYKYWQERRQTEQSLRFDGLKRFSDDEWVCLPATFPNLTVKEMLQKPAVVTRTFFRHLNIVALKVCRVNNTCIIFVFVGSGFYLPVRNYFIFIG